MDAKYLKAPKIPFFFNSNKINFNTRKTERPNLDHFDLGLSRYTDFPVFSSVIKCWAFELSRSTKMSSVQRLGVPAFFTITAVHGLSKSSRERGWVFICNLHNLYSAHIQSMLMHMIAWRNENFISWEKCILVFFIQSPRCSVIAPYKSNWWEVRFEWMNEGMRMKNFILHIKI